MKLPIANCRLPIERKNNPPNHPLSAASIANRQSPITNASGFTMVEIAISLAIIGIALVAIIGVLPLGMNVQQENRESTIINQDATIFMEAIRSGAHGLDDLTNYVYLITNTATEYANGVPQTPIPYGYTYSGSTRNNTAMSPGIPLNSGTNIIGLLSTPEYIDPNNNGAPSLDIDIANGNYISNHIVAYVRSISGAAVEKPPQNNDILRNDSFGYRVLCVNAPVAIDTNSLDSPYNRQLSENLRELRLTFLWPQLPNGKVGAGHQTFRALVAGQLQQFPANNNLYFYQSQSFVANTNAP